MTICAFNGLVFLTLVIGRKKKDELLDALSDMGAQLTNIIYGRKTVETSYLMDALGLAPEEHKAVITCVATEDTADDIMDMLIKEFHFDDPNTGIAFTVPVAQLSF